MATFYEMGDLMVAGGDRYRVEGILGTGGMARVYLARELTLNKLVVAKVLDPDLSARRPEATKAFQIEARALAQMESEHLPRVSKLGITTDAFRAHFYVMDRIVGHSMKTLLEHHGAKHGTKALRLHQALDLGGQVAQGLATVHAYGIVHCDIKPDNVLLYLGTEGSTRVKIIDFGVSRILDDREHAKRFVGTPAYGAPEQILERPVGVKADIFALGLVLFELATGRWAYESAGNDYARARQRAHVQAPSLAQFGSFPPAFVQLVARALSLDPAQRPEALSMAGGLYKIARELEPRRVHEASTVPSLAARVSVRVAAMKPLTYADVSSTDVDVDMAAMMRAVERSRAPRPSMPNAGQTAEPRTPRAFGAVVRTVPMPARPRVPTASMVMPAYATPVPDRGACLSTPGQDFAPGSVVPRVGAGECARRAAPVECGGARALPHLPAASLDAHGDAPRVWRLQGARRHRAARGYDGYRFGCAFEDGETRKSGAAMSAWNDTTPDPLPSPREAKTDPMPRRDAAPRHPKTDPVWPPGAGGGGGGGAGAGGAGAGPGAATTRAARTPVAARRVAASAAPRGEKGSDTSPGLDTLLDGIHAPRTADPRLQGRSAAITAAITSVAPCAAVPKPAASKPRAVARDTKTVPGVYQRERTQRRWFVGGGIAFFALFSMAAFVSVRLWVPSGRAAAALDSVPLDSVPLVVVSEEKEPRATVVVSSEAKPPPARVLLSEAKDPTSPSPAPSPSPSPAPRRPARSDTPPSRPRAPAAAAPTASVSLEPAPTAAAVLGDIFRSQ